MSAFAPWSGPNFKHDATPVKKYWRKVRRDRYAPDRKGTIVVLARSEGICEACGEHWAVHVHHQLGGHGVRGRGLSALPENKLHLCLECHQAAHEAKK